MHTETEKFMYSMQAVITTDNISFWLEIILWWHNKIRAQLSSVAEYMDS